MQRAPRGNETNVTMATAGGPDDSTEALLVSQPALAGQNRPEGRLPDPVRITFHIALNRQLIGFVDVEFRGLDLSPYLSTTVASGPDAGAVYDLFAVVNHYGSILYGHYTAFARCPANDADNNRENLVGKNTLIWRALFFHRISLLNCCNVKVFINFPRTSKFQLLRSCF